jgi:thiol-disulfide isomerase/thioredoxin
LPNEGHAVLTKIVVAMAVMAVASVAYAWIRSRDGRVRAMATASGGLSSADLGATRGFRATLVQFSTDTCSKCPPTARLLGRIADSVPGVRHVEVDAVARLDLARRFEILRTPTVLVLNHEGRVVARMSGAPSEAHAREALELAPPPTTDYSI